MNLTIAELRTAQHDFTRDLALPVTICGVEFHRTDVNGLAFRHGNASGLIHDGNVQELDALCWAAERADIERRTIVIPVRYHEEAVQALADFPDNGYLGEQPDGRNYYLLWKLSCRYSDECRFNPSFAPDLHAAAAAVTVSWREFTR